MSRSTILVSCSLLGVLAACGGAPKPEPAAAPPPVKPVEVKKPEPKKIEAKKAEIKKVDAKPAANKPMAKPAPKVVNAKAQGGENWEEF